MRSGAVSRGVVLVAGAALAAIATFMVFGRPGGPPSSTSPEGVVRIPTREATEPNVLCTLGAAVPPLRGVLGGDAGDAAWPVWLSLPGGEVAYVVWPFGWSARFEPSVILLDASGRAVARDGTEIKFDQISIGSAAGTREDPYIARGLFLDGCYP